MLATIIRMGKNNYYLDLNIKEDTLTYNVILANNNGTRNLKVEEAKQLLETIMSGKKEFKEIKDGYHIYLDENGNKRFFKDGREDYIKFFQNNGSSALLHDQNNKEKSLVKKFTLTTKNSVIVLVITSMMAVTAVSFSDNIIDKIHYEDNRKVVEQRLDVNDVNEFINNSEGNITEEQKEYLYNEDFIEDVLTVADDSRNYILRKKIENISIKYGGKTFEETDYLGYYSPLESNCIYLRDDSDEIFGKALAHEFVHLMQDDNNYSYIEEASAEMMAEEYYGSRATAYPDQRRNLKILMEIIGPKPVMELNFKGDTTSFEEAIYEKLDKEKADRLLELFRTNIVDPDVDVEAVDSEIYELLSEMAYNINGMELGDINNPIFRASMMRLAYFNQRLDNYYKSYEYYTDNSEYLGEEKIQNIDFSKVTEYEVSIWETISKEEYDKLCQIKTDEYEASKNSCWNTIAEYIRNDPQTGEEYYKVNEEIISETEAEERGYMKHTYTKHTNKKLYNFDDIKKEARAGCDVRVIMSFVDGTIGSFSLSDGQIPETYVHNRPGEKRVIPSLADKFPEQMMKNNDIDKLLEDQSYEEDLEKHL